MIHRTLPQRTGAAWAAAIGLGGALLLAVVVSDSTRLIGRSFPGFLVWDNGTVVAFHAPDWTGPQLGVPPTALLLDVDGQPYVDGTAFLSHAAELGEGQPVRYRVRHRSEETTYTVPTMRLTWAGYLSTFGIYLGNAVLLLVVGAVAVLLRPDRSAARAVALAATALALVLTLTVDILSTFRFTSLFVVVETLLPAAFGYLAVAFPLQQIATRGKRYSLLVFAGALLGLGLVQVELFRASPELYERINAGVYILLVLSLMGVLAGFGRELIRSPSPESRMQAAIVFAGATAAAAPAAALICLTVLLDWSISYTWIVAFVPFLPLSVLYAALLQDLFRAERLVRLTVGYALASSVVLIAYTTTLVGVDRLMLAGASRHPAALLGVVAALTLAMDPLRARVQHLIDRVFFRTSVDVAAVLERTSTEFATARQESAIQRLAVATLEGELTLEWAEFALGEASRMSPALVEPVQFRGQRLGRLSCGPKRSGAPFSERERELVRGLAGQAALALQNARSLEALQGAQAELLRNERFAEIGAMAAAVAHGIRNPLAGIRAAAQLARELSSGDSASEPLADIVSEVDRLDTRLHTLLDFSRPYQLRPQIVDVTALLREVSRGLEARARAQGVAVRLSLPPDCLRAYLDPGLLEESIQELAANALRALERGGEISLGLWTHDSVLSIRVCDTGPGIPEAVQSRVFDLFFTTRPDGTGMGLPAVKSAVERQGGQVELESSGPSGTSFRIDLPARDARAVASGPRSPGLESG